LAVSRELAGIGSPQEVVCTAMARLRERTGVSRVTLAELDEDRNEAVLLRESGGAESRVEMASVPLEPFTELASEARQGLATVIRDTRTDDRAANNFYDCWEGDDGAG